jgi:hypothetical protein
MSSSSPDSPRDLRTEPSHSRVSEVLRSAVDLFVLAPTHERAEIRAFADLITGLIPDATIEDRAHVARRLAHRADTPPSVARLLAADEIAVAQPVVLRSPVLTSADLVEIMRFGPAHVELVAERLDLAPDVAAALCRSVDVEAATRPARRETATPAIEAMHTAAMLARVADSRPIGDAETESEVALQRALDELAAELEAEAAAGPTAASPSDDEAEAALQHALDRLASELDAEARAWEDEDAAARTLRRTAPDIAGDIDVFLSHDSAGRWRFIQEHTTATTLAPPPPRRRRSDDPVAIGARLFGALVAGERERLAEDLGRAARLDRPVIERILTDRNGEALAITLAALGIDERTATSILLLHSGERATLTHMQDLSAMAGRIGWRTAENIVQTWRGGRGLGRVETARVVEQSDRRGLGRQETNSVDRTAGAGDGDRLRGNER